MRRDKTFARILFIFSIANVVLAAPAVRQRRFITDRYSDESTPLLDNLIDSYSTSQSSVTQASPPSSAGSLHQDSAPVSVDPQLNDPQPVSGTSELHDDTPSSLGNPPSQDDAPQTSVAAQLKNDPLPGTGSQALHDDIHPSWHDHDWQHVTTEIEEVAEPDVHDVHNVQDVHPVQGYYEDYHYFDLDDDEIKLNFANDDNEVKPKTFCGLRLDCFDWEAFKDSLFDDEGEKAPEMTWDASHVRWRRTRPFQRSPERDHGHRFSWAVRFYTLPSQPCRHLNHVTTSDLRSLIVKQLLGIFHLVRLSSVVQAQFYTVFNTTPDPERLVCVVSLKLTYEKLGWVRVGILA